ncbi:MAG: flagellar assembly protein FliW, partial [Planctomycetota bacterium]
MDVITTRFGRLSIDPEDLLTFEQGIIGLRDLRRWLVLADSQNALLGWLQSVDSAETALGIVNPRRFLPDYRVRVGRRDIQTLQLTHVRDAHVLAVISRSAGGLSLNLRAPLVVNVEGRCGCQVIARDDYPVKFLLAEPASE